MCSGICVNSTANPKVDVVEKSLEEIGNKTECALLKLAFSNQFDFRNYRPDTKKKIKKQIPFSSERKMMITIYQLDENKFRIFFKGAPEFLMPKCIEFLNSEGHKEKLQDVMIKNF